MERFTKHLFTFLGLGSLALGCIGFLPMYLYYATLGVAISNHATIADMSLDALGSIVVLVFLSAAVGTLVLILFKISAVIYIVSATIRSCWHELGIAKDDASDADAEADATQTRDLDPKQDKTEFNVVLADAYREAIKNWKKRKTQLDFVVERRTLALALALLSVSICVWATAKTARAHCLLGDSNWFCSLGTHSSVSQSNWVQKALRYVSGDRAIRSVSVQLSMPLKIDDKQVHFLPDWILAGGTEHFVFLLPSQSGKEAIAINRAAIAFLDHGKSIQPAKMDPEPKKADKVLPVAVSVTYVTEHPDWIHTNCTAIDTEPDIYFDGGSATVSPSMFQGVAAMSEFLDQDGSEDYWLVGYADPSGSARANFSLAQERALEIAAALQLLHNKRVRRVIGVGEHLEGGDDLEQWRTVKLFDCSSAQEAENSAPRITGLGQVPR